MSSFERGIGRLFNTLAGELPALLYGQMVLRIKYAERGRLGVRSDDPRLQVSGRVLEEYVRADRDRISRIEDKARGTVVGVAVAVSILGAGIGLFGENGLFDAGDDVGRWAAAVLLLGLLYLLGS